MPIKWRSKILLAKIEASYGVDAAPTGAANAILATEVSLSPMEGNDISRELELPYLAAQATIPVELHAALNFKVELVPAGAAGTAPAWGPLLRACGAAQVISAGASVTYNPVSDNHESVTVHLWIGGTRYVLKGARGTCNFRLNAQTIPYLEFAFKGMFAVPAETARPTATLTNFQNPQPVNTVRTPTFTLDALPFVMRSFVMNMGNEVEGRFLVGSDSIIIPNRAESIECTVEAVPLTTYDPYTQALNQTAHPLVLVHGTEAGLIARLNVPRAQMQRPTGLENAQNITEWPLRMVPLPNTGNDQWTLVLT